MIHTGTTTGDKQQQGAARGLNAMECENLIRTLGGSVVDKNGPKNGETEWMKKGTGKRVVLFDDMIDDEDVVGAVRELEQEEKVLDGENGMHRVDKEASKGKRIWPSCDSLPLFLVRPLTLRAPCSLRSPHSGLLLYGRERSRQEGGES
jgi:hypothetical protein